MIDLKELRDRANGASSCVSFTKTDALELIDQLEAAQKDAARYQYLARLKHAWAVLGDIYDLPSEDEGAKDLGSSIDIAIASNTSRA